MSLDHFFHRSRGNKMKLRSAKNFDVVRRSARLAERFRPGVAAKERDVSVVESRVCSSVRSVTASVSSRAPHQTVHARTRGTTRGGAQSQGCGLPAVENVDTRPVVALGTASVVLERCRVTKIRYASVVLERCPIKDIRSASVTLSIEPVGENRLDSREIGSFAIKSALRPANKQNARKKTVRFADPTPPHTASGPMPQNLEVGLETNLGTASTGVRLLQLNMRRSAVVTGEVRQLVAKKRLDVLLLQEPYVKKQGSSHTFGLGVGMKIAAVRSQRPWAAVAICNPNFNMVFVSQLSTTHCVCVEVQALSFSFYIVSCYFQYSDEIEKHLRHLETVFRSLRGERIIVGVDANARSSLWGPQETDDRGAKFEDLIRAFGMFVVNDARQPPTFWTTRGSSFIDVTLASPSMSKFLCDWKVRSDWTTSDHRAVDIRLRLPKESGGDRSAGNTRFDTSRADWERFSVTLTDLSRSQLEAIDLCSTIEVEKMAETLTVVLTETCAASMPRKRKFRKSNPWWTRKLTTFKKKVYRLRRALQGGREEPAYLRVLLEYRSLQRQYCREVRRTKLASWRKFVTSHGNREPWGFVYKHQASKLQIEGVLSALRCGEYSTKSIRETASYLLDVHISDDREIEDTLEQREIRNACRVAPDTVDAPFFTEAEVTSAVKTFKNNKAPGLDLVEVAVIKAACKVIPGQLVRLFNGCLQWGVFPSVWKRGSLRVLLKGEDKDERDPKSYRPICLLSVVGKLFEKLIKARLLDTSLAPEKVSRRQFGFMPGRSTEEAVVELRRMVSASEGRYAVALLFDISGAFDNVWWPLVLDSLKKRDCPRNIFEVLRSYFSDRSVKISISSAEVSKRATRGCPQGSVLGPACWNLMFDGLLKVLEDVIPDKFAAYADDLVVVINGNSRRELETEGQRVVNTITEWCRSAKLQISERKTEAIILRSDAIARNPIGRRGGARPDRKRKINKKTVDFENRPPTIKIGDTKIAFKQTVRYLGVHLDRNLKVRSHCEYLNSKVGPLFEKLGRVARAQWGLRFRTLSTIYRGVFAPTVAYAAAGWADLCTESDIRILKALQRRVLISMTGAYRTASWESLCVVGGATPIDIVLRENAARYNVRSGIDARIGNIEIHAETERKTAIEEIKNEAINMWQTRWNSSSKGRTTFAFFRNVRDRLIARSLDVNHWSTQVLTGHGDFRERLASLGLVKSDVCICGGGVDSVQHFLLECPLFDAQREVLRSVVPEGEWQWPDVARFFVSSQEALSVFTDFCRESLWLKGCEP